MLAKLTKGVIVNGEQTKRLYLFFINHMTYLHISCLVVALTALELTIARGRDMVRLDIAECLYLDF